MTKKISVKNTERISLVKIGILFLVLTLMFFPPVHAEHAPDYLQNGRLTKRTPSMEQVFDEIYNQDADNYIFNAMAFVQGYLTPESWTETGILSARESFEKKVGTCTEISVLFCSMMRYKGIPCNFGVKQVYNDYAHMFPIVSSIARGTLLNKDGNVTADYTGL